MLILCDDARRSRFLELHIGDIPDAELSTILERRCAIAPSYATKLVTCMRELQRYRQVPILHHTVPVYAERGGGRDEMHSVRRREVKGVMGQRQTRSAGCLEALSQMAPILLADTE